MLLRNLDGQISQWMLPCSDTLLTSCCSLCGNLARCHSYRVRKRDCPTTREDKASPLWQSEKARLVTLQLFLQERQYRTMTLVVMTLKYHEGEIMADRVTRIGQTRQSARLICVSVHLKQSSTALEAPRESGTTQLKPRVSSQTLFSFSSVQAKHISLSLEI